MTIISYVCENGDITKEIVVNVASSHLARRCFVGNLYKQVKDPNLVGALSGHKEGSRAFARYREIDEDMKGSGEYAGVGLKRNTPYRTKR